MKICITGVAGFLGSWLAETLLEQGHDVSGIDDLSGGTFDNLPGDCVFHCGDILDLDAVSMAAERCDAIYHCAALAYEGLSVFSPSLITQNIVTGSVNVMVAAIRSGVKRVINCSSMARYGDNPPPYRERLDPWPVDPYGLAKVAAEQQMTLLGSIHGVKVLHAVPHNIIGPRQRYDDPYRNVASIMANRLLQGKRPIIYGDGQQVRCFSFIDDVLPTMVQMLDCAADHGEVFNVGPDEGAVTIECVCQILRTLTGRLDLVPEYHPDRPREVKVAYCSSDKIRERFGYRSRTSLEEGLASIVSYIREQGTKPFRYDLPIEIDGANLPRTWKERLL